MNDDAPKVDSTGFFDFVDYDPVRPHPMFTAPQIAYIHKIEDYLSQPELDVVRKIERFRIDLKTGIVRRDEVPGLRSLPGEMVIYIQRSSDKPYPKMMEKTIDTIAGEPMGPDMFKRLVQAYKVTVGDEPPFYPVKFGGYFDKWRAKTNEAAAALGVATGEWDQGKFTISDGRVLPLAATRIEAAGADTDLRAW